MNQRTNDAVGEATLTACSVCIEENQRSIAAEGGTRPVPVLVVGGPEAQQCEHLAAWVRGGCVGVTP